MVGKWDDGTAQKATADAIAVQRPFVGITAQGGDTGVVQAMIDAGHPFVPFGGETRERLPQVLRRASRRRPEVHLGRHRRRRRSRSPSRRRSPRSRARSSRSRSSCRSPSCRIPNFKDGRGLLLRPVRQLLRRQRLPDLRHQFHGAGDHGPDARTTSKLLLCGSAPRGSSPRRFSCATQSPREGAIDGWRIGAAPLFRMEGVSKRYGGVRALEKAELDRRSRAASMPSSARTAPASPR